MNQVTIQLDLGMLAVIVRFMLAAVVLLVFGFYFNRRVELAERTGELEGFTWFYVTIGVAVTLLAPGLILFELLFPAWVWAIILFVAFACSGWPMSWGAMQRYLKARRAHQESLREAARARGDFPK